MFRHILKIALFSSLFLVGIFSNAQVTSIFVLAGDTTQYFRIDAINIEASNCSVIKTDGTCDGKGSVELIIESLNPNFQILNYSLSGRTVNTSALSHKFENVCKAPYVLEMTGFVSNAPPTERLQRIVIVLTVDGSEVFSTTPVLNNIQCSGEDNGSINLNVAGGTPPYDIIWNHGPTTENITNLSPNEYFVDITDQLGCNTKDTFAITDGDTITADFNFNDACVNTPIDFTDNSTTNNGTLSYEWSFSNGTPSTANTVGPHNITFNTGGNNDVKLKISNGICVDSITKTANIFPPPTITLTKDDNICFGESIQLLATGGTTYSWTGAGLSATNIPNPIASPTVTTTYEVTVTNADGCSDIASVTITVDPLPVIDASNDTSVCINESVSLSASGGNSYLWSPTTGIIGSNTSPTINTIITTNITYKVVVSNANNCKDSTDITVTAKDLPLVNSTEDLEICENQSTQLTVTGADSYVWTPNTAINNTTSNNPIVNPTVTTQYFVTGTSANGCINTDSTLVTVNLNPTITVSNDTSICEQQSVTLQASGGVSYLWKPVNKTTSSITETPLTTTVYEAVTTDNNGCKDSAQVTVTVTPLPTITTSNDTTICQNDTAFLSVSGANTYLWSPAVSNNVSTNPFATPISNTVYKVVGTDGNGCKDSSEVSVSVNTLPSVTLPEDSTICFAGSLDITASGATTYSWSPSTGLSSTSGATVTATPANSITYQVSGEDANQCSDTASITITVQPEITVQAMDDLTVCKDESTPLTAIVTNATTTIWSPITGVADINVSSTTVTPTTTTTYTITASNATGCTNTDNVTITVDESPNVTISKDTSICESTPVTLTATGGNTYSWNPTGSSSDNITVSPNTTTQYNVTIGTPAGCDVDTSVTITVFPLPTASSINDTNICLNSELDYTINSGTNTVSWVSKNNGILSTNDNLTYTPTASDSVFVIFQNANNCTETDTIAINVFSLPTVSVTPTDTTVCLGDTATFTASGADSYNWITNTGDILSENNSTTQIVTATTKAYQVIGTDANGCMDSTDLNITVSPIPNIIASNDTTICFNDTITLNVSGADSYTWTPSTTLDAPTSASTKAFPTTATQYIVTGEFTSGCSNTDTVNVTVQPEITIQAMDDLTICKDESTPLTAIVTNATTTIWSPITGVADINATNTTVTPTTTTTYTITASNATGCTNTDEVTITVDESPNVTISNDTSICEGSPVTLTATGGNTYIWTPTGSNNDNITVTPNTTTQYNVTIGTPAGCDVDTSVTITVFPLPTASAINDTNICLNSELNYTVNSGINTVSWVSKNNGILSTNDNLTYTPTASDSVFVIFQNANNCTETDTIAINVFNLPSVSVTPTDTTVCLGDTATFTASGADNYNWITNTGDILTDNNSTTQIVTATTKAYQVIGTDANGCKDSTDLNITVSPIPNVIASNDTTICFNDTISITASGADNYSWAPIASLENPKNATTKAFPTTTTQYIVTGEFTSGCSNTDTVNVIVQPEITVQAMDDIAVCKDESTPLTAIVTNATTTTWSPITGVTDINASSTTVTPITTTTYTITASNATGCTNTDNVTITVDESPNVTISKDTSICEGTPVTLTATGGNTYSWNPTGSSSDNITVSPNTTTQYNVTIGTPAGCDVDTSVTVTTIPLPTKPSIADTTICEGSILNLNYNTTDNIRWSKTDGTTIGTTSTLNYTPIFSEDIIVTLTNGNNCTISDTFTVTIQNQPIVDITSNNGTTICNGEELTLTATGATTYEWNTIPGIVSTDLTQDTIVIKPTVTTTYQVTGTVSNCTVNNSIEIDVKEVPTITVSSDTNVCQNSTVTLIASGASSYVWSPNVDGMTNPNNSFTNVTPTEDRVFTVIGTAGNGCTNSNQVSITTSETPSGIVSGQKDTLCFDEEITLVATLDPQYTGNVNGAYSFNNNAFSANNEFDIIGNPSGEQQIDVVFKNQFGCTSAPIEVKVFVLEQITYEVDTIHFPSCEDPAPSGEFTLKNIVGGSGNYSINFNNFVTTDINFVFQNISPGSYPLNVTDNKGCENPSILNFNSSLDFDTTIIEPTCNNFTDGSINLSNITGGVAPYQFSLNGKTNYQADSNFTNLSADDYTIFVKDASDCEVPLLFNLNEPLALEHTIINFTPEKCVGDNNGLISFVIKGGTVDYITNINSTTVSGDTISLTNLSPDTYNFIVTDSEQCTYNDSIVVTPADSIITYASQKLQLKDCKSGDASGVIDSTIGGSGFYQYSIDDGATFKDKTNFEQNELNELNAGIYVIITKDVVSTCTSQSTLAIGSSIDLDTLDHNATPPSCTSLVDGRIELLNFNALGLGDLRFELVESPSLNPVFSKRFSHTFQGDENSNLTSGNYIIIIHDENDCKYNHDVTVPEVNVVTVNDSITPTSCGEENGSVQFDISGGELPYTITFTYPNKTDSISTNILFDTLGAGIYHYSITDNASCITTDSVELFNDQVDIVTEVDSLICYGDNSGAIKVIELNNADTSKFNYTFIFDNQQETTDSNFINLNGGWYTLQVNQRDKTSDTLLCTYNDFNQYYNVQYQDSLYDSLYIDKINIPSPDSIFSYTQTIPSDADEDNGEILIDSIYGIEAPHFISLNDTNSFKLHVPGDQSKFQSLGQGEYLLFTKDNKGCLDTLVLNVGVSFFMPNVFTPNFDGKNDYLEIFDFDSPIYLKVYDQWGTIIYEMEEYDNSWDGGTAPDGTYFYEVITDDKKLTGWVQIIR